MDATIIKKNDWTATLLGMSIGQVLTLTSPTVQEAHLLRTLAAKFKRTHDRHFTVSFSSGNPFILTRLA